MATYNYLPVYKVSYDFLIEIFEVIKNFSKEYKYTLGDKIKNEVLEMIINIYRANSVYDKKPSIIKARENIEVIRLLCRLSKDLRILNLNKFVFLNEKIESISKQLARWQESKNNGPESFVAKAQASEPLSVQ